MGFVLSCFSKYPFKFMLQQQVTKIFGKTLTQWMVKLFKDQLSIKASYRSLILIVNKIGRGEKSILSQIIFYHLDLEHYIILSELQNRRRIEQIMARVAMRKRQIVIFDFVRATFAKLVLNFQDKGPVKKRNIIYSKICTLYEPSDNLERTSDALVDPKDEWKPFKHKKGNRPLL